MHAPDPRDPNPLPYHRPERDDSIPIRDLARAAIKVALALGISLLVMVLLASLGQPGDRPYR